MPSPFSIAHGISELGKVAYQEILPGIAVGAQAGKSVLQFADKRNIRHYFFSSVFIPKAIVSKIQPPTTRPNERNHTTR